MTAGAATGREDVVRVVPGFHERRVGAQAFVLQADSTMHVFDNATGIHLWDRIVAAGEGGVATEALADDLVERWEVDPSTARADVLDFLSRLAAAGLIARTCEGGID